MSGGEGGITQNSLGAVLDLRASPLMRLGAKYSLSRTWSNLRFSSLFVSAPIKNASTREALLIRWRRRRDSNPRYAINVYSLSRGAPSATRPLLRVLSLISFDTSLWTLPGSALLDAARLALRVALVTRALLHNLRSLGQHSATSPNFSSMTRENSVISATLRPCRAVRENSTT